MANIVFNYFLYIIVPLGIISFMAWKITSNKKAIYASMLAIIIFLTILFIFMYIIEKNDPASFLSYFVYIASMIGAFIGTLIGSFVTKRYTKNTDVILIMFIITFASMLATLAMSLDGMLMLFAFDVIEIPLL